MKYVIFLYVLSLQVIQLNKRLCINVLISLIFIITNLLSLIMPTELVLI